MKFNHEEINQGDLVDFGSYGRLYVCNIYHSEDRFWVTDRKEDRNNNNARGWNIRKNLARRIVEKFEEDEDFEDEEEI